MNTPTLPFITQGFGQLTPTYTTPLDYDIYAVGTPLHSLDYKKAKKAWKKKRKNPKMKQPNTNKHK
jgi:hypothetical protein